MCGGNSVGCRRGRTARRHQGGGHVARTEGRHHAYRHGDFRRGRRYSLAHSRRGRMYGHLRRHGRIPHGQDEPNQEPNRRRTVDRHRFTRRRHCLCHGARRALRSLLFAGTDDKRSADGAPCPDNPLDDGLRVLSRLRACRSTLHVEIAAYADGGDVCARRVVEEAESEICSGHGHVFHHRALNCFVGCPVGRIGETPYLKRDALARGVHDAHENLLVVADCGIVEQPLAHVGPEKTEIRVAGAVDHRQARRIVRMAEGTELFDVGPDDGILLRDGIDHLLRRGGDGVGVDNHRLHDSSTPAVFHAAPVLKRRGDEGVGGQSDNRVVEILNFHGRQGHVGHNAVGNCRWDDNPVAHTQHIVLREL